MYLLSCITLTKLEVVSKRFVAFYLVFVDMISGCLLYILNSSFTSIPQNGEENSYCLNY